MYGFANQRNLGIGIRQALCSHADGLMYYISFVTCLLRLILNLLSFVPQFYREDIEANVDGIFSRLDRNGDGVVTIEEFIEACQTVSKEAKKEQRELFLDLGAIRL